MTTRLTPELAAQIRRTVARAVAAPPRLHVPTAEELGGARDLVIHAPDRTGEAALCGRPTSPDRILARGSVTDIDCPKCAELLRTEDGLADVKEGAAAACARLAERFVAGSAPGDAS